MLLTVDIGNTTVCFSGLERTETEDYRVVFSSKRDTDPARTPEDWEMALHEILGEYTFEGAVLSSVVPEVTQPVCTAVEAYLGYTPMQVNAHTDTGLTIRVPEPEKLGADRLVDAAWVAANYPLPAVTVDLGTATTMNVLGPGGVFLGGAIALGVETSLHTLGSMAAQLPPLEVSTPETLIGKTTEECMRVGAITGTAAVIDGLVSGVENRLGPVTLVLTGGLSRWVSPLCRHAHVCDPQLLPKGLALIYDRQFHKSVAGLNR